MKVYIVTTGCYSDYSINAVFSEKIKAENYINEYLKKHYCYDPEDIEINEYELDEQYEKIPGKYEYSVQISKDGRAYCTPYNPKTAGCYGQELFAKEDQNKEYILMVSCWSDDEKGAIKIANEKRSQLIAENRWPKYKESPIDEEIKELIKK